MKQGTLIMLLAAGLLCGCTSGTHWKRQAYAFSLPAVTPGTNVPGTLVALSRVSISPMFQSRSFTYRTGENSYQQDPYAEFLIPPERALAEAIRDWMSASGVFGRLVEPGSGLTPALTVEVSVRELYADLRNPGQPVGRMVIHLVCYQVKDGAPGRTVLDTVSAHEAPLARKNPGALMTAWDADLREILQEIGAEYAKAAGAGVPPSVGRVTVEK